MKIKIFFLISAMNALSYLCFGNCCENCWDCWEECFGKEDENIKEKFFLEEKKNTGEEFKKFVSEDWLKEKGNGLKFKIYKKKEGGSKGADIKVTKYTNGEIKVKNFNPEKDKNKWALFEIKYKEKGKEKEETVYLYCSDIDGIDGSKSMKGIFKRKKKIFSISVLVCDTINVKNMDYMFYSCFDLEILNLSNFDIKKVTNMEGMFSDCSNLKKIKFPDIFDTSNVTNVDCMFSGCSNLENLNLSNFDTSRVTDMRFMFDNCNSLNEVTVSNLKTKDKIFEELKKKEEGWKESEKDGKFVLIKNQN